MNSETFRKKYYKEWQDFLMSELGKALQITILYERDKSHLNPTSNLTYSLTELSSAQYNREKGWDACFFLLRECATPVPPPQQQVEQTYDIPNPKKKG
jgi:hypothetical protein